MAINKRHMKTIILRNGHLNMDGTETTEELREALYFLRQHTYAKCQKPYLGTPIDSLMPDISALGTVSTKSSNARQRIVDIELTDPTYERRAS